MDAKEADDAEFQRLIEHHKTDIQASNMTRDELIDLLARNLAYYNLLTKYQEENLQRQKESIQYQDAIIKAKEQHCELLRQQNSETERKLSAVVNAMPKAISAGMEAGKKMLASSAGKKGGVKKNARTRELKEWALQEAATIRGTDIEISRTLAKRVPKHLADASENSQRLIYDTLLERHKQKKPKPVRGFLPSRLAASRNG